ncbi:hypothetical protein N7532_004751 [Penicillium argentinense]|uniref:Uncharacterized protein n=1 Tax=Penicillium argentinense TaxID=1131581 RepID=A0A9W9KGF8_9EURO|nr:uncharacterized protein N7532_004751 [Penicillium argentinense]KAJ5104222.1 hypothetical protein N7532_004751 [Penicillium argentinense]
MPLHPGDVQEAEIRRLQEGNAQREIDAHAEVLHIIGEHGGHRCPDGVGDLTKNPVDMKKGNRRKPQWQTADSDHGDVTIPPQEYRTGE